MKKDGEANPPVGGELVALSSAAVLAALVGCWAPPAPGWRWWLLAAATAAAVRGLVRGGRGWWLACGVLVGGAAASWSAPPAELVVQGRQTVRFEATVRDGWVAAPFGWRTRVRLHAVGVAQRSLPHPREVSLTVSSDAPGHVLPGPGSRIAGVGELRWRDGPPVQRPFLSVKSPLLLQPVHPPRGLDAVREALLAAVAGAAGVDVERLRAAGLAGALILGRREGLGEGEVGTLREAGLAHLLAVSGLHVGLVAMLAWWGLRLVGVRPKAGRWVIMAAVVSFALLAGWAPPVRRAASAVVLYLLARQLGRPLEPLPTVWGVVALLALREPEVLLEPGFQLSAGVTLALVRWVEPLASGLPLPRPVGMAVAVALVAQAAALPLVGAHFGMAAPLAVLANLAAAPLAVALVLASLLAVLAAPLWPAMAGGALDVLGLAQRVLRGVAAVGAGAAQEFPPVPVALAVVLLGLGVAALGRWRGAALAGLAGVIVATGWAILPERPVAGAGEVRMLPVREGTALLLRDRRTRVLVDTGRHPREALEALAAFRTRRLHALVLTHADEDHLGGALAVLRHLRVDELVLPRAARGEAELAPLLRLARQRGARERWAGAGEGLSWESMRAAVLWPPAGTWLRGNEASLVLRVEVAGTTLLLTGDIERIAEGRLMAARLPLRAPLLQAPHHGSRTSATAAFLAAVSPRVVFVPTGVQPRWAYPHPEVVARVRALPAALLAQRHGHEHLWWEGGKAVWVGHRQAVRIHLDRPEVR